MAIYGPVSTLPSAFTLWRLQLRRQLSRATTTTILARLGLKSQLYMQKLQRHGKTIGI